MGRKKFRCVADTEAGKKCCKHGIASEEKFLIALSLQHAVVCVCSRRHPGFIRTQLAVPKATDKNTTEVIDSSDHKEKRGPNRKHVEMHRSRRKQGNNTDRADGHIHQGANSTRPTLESQPDIHPTTGRTSSKNQGQDVKEQKEGHFFQKKKSHRRCAGRLL